MVIKFTSFIHILISFGHETNVIDPIFAKSVLRVSFLKASKLFEFI